MSKYCLGKYKTIKGYVKGKIRALTASDMTMSALYGFMFSERENIMAEFADGSGRTVTQTYGQCREHIEEFSKKLKTRASVGRGATVGLYMNNSVSFICAMWAILKCGFVPLLMNMRLDGERLAEVLRENEVAFVISDGQRFECDTATFDEIERCAPTLCDDEWADEVIVMSSGTSPHVKLCAYTGDSFSHQILDSARIISKNRQIRKHYRHRLKLLAFLPLYHIFGLAAVYMWFGFFSRTFVFLPDMRPQTIQRTIKRHKVTHIFAVPLFWNTVYKEFRKKLAERGARVVKKCDRALAIAKKTGSKLFSRVAFGEVRDNIFGRSVKFMISGGGAIPPQTLAFFNAIGYHLANGYGMSEIGISSVELSCRPKKLSRGSVGKPFSSVRYEITSDGELSVGGMSSAKRITECGKTVELGGAPYATRDLACERNGGYYILGRRDDVIVGENGENINPDWSESRMNIDGASELCILSLSGVPTLFVRVNEYASQSRLSAVRESAEREIERAGLSGTVKRVLFTSSPLVTGDDFKPNRRLIAERIQRGEIPLFDDAEAVAERRNDALHEAVRALVAKALSKSADDISDDANFFFELGASSLDYLSLVALIKDEFGADVPKDVATVDGLCEYIADHAQ